MPLARVQELITDKVLHKKYYEIYGGENSLGGILFTWLDDPSPLYFNPSNCSFAAPYNYNVSHYPVAGEIVEVTVEINENYNMEGGQSYYYKPPLSIYQLPTSDAYPDSLSGEEVSFYKGKYFPDPSNINPLLPYEGDIMIEGRFGQSIRFGSTVDNEKVTYKNRWSNEGKIGDPITIIRNGQSFNPNISTGDRTIENMDEDPSSIYLCSNQQLTNFTPASLYDESYGADIYVVTRQDEPVISDITMSSDVQEDVELSSADPLPAEELLIVEEVVKESEPQVYYDIAETEDIEDFIGAEDIVLGPNYNVPEG